MEPPRPASPSHARGTTGPNGHGAPGPHARGAAGPHARGAADAARPDAGRPDGGCPEAARPDAARRKWTGRMPDRRNAARLSEALQDPFHLGPPRLGPALRNPVHLIPLTPNPTGPRLGRPRIALPTSGRRRRMLRAAAVAGLLLAVMAAHPTTPADAEPRPTGKVPQAPGDPSGGAPGKAPGGPGQAPDGKDLTSQAFRLADQLEQLTEQYNGLKVKLQASQAAAKGAIANARQQQTSLGDIRGRLSRIAATSYMVAGGTDPAVSFAVTRNPQQILDRAATLRYFATQNSAQFVGLMQAMQAADRARKAAQERTQEVGVLRRELDAQRTKITAAYEKIRGQIVKRDPASLAKLPVIGDDIGARALRLAMTKIGDPYVWGAAGPSSFDCSGLVMWAYDQLGVNLPHYTGDQWNAGRHIPRDRLRPGDLVFFYPDLHHMGIYVGDGKILHAPHTGDVVKIDDLDGRPFAGAVRIS
ncbi:C40 family peptidase [Actinomadura rupiterrae]|uniref:C40 family peptidase n=1 Tax=Actinomadura rupiterrae TaxID=559627 RepID=UPI0020A46536|nr:NlpC/P60 family protein [Actinomadura rupiterrae]MCP2342863.1 cell wall-associated NlpC family hydrolase [Actinomadura rupiterrae]